MVHPIWAVACTMIMAGALFLGAGCASTKSQMKEFDRMDVGEGPGSILVRLTELQKQTDTPSVGTSSGRTNTTKRNSATLPHGSIKEETIPPQTAPNSQKPLIAHSSSKPPASPSKPETGQDIRGAEPSGANSTAETEPPDAPKTTQLEAKGNSFSPANPSAAFSTLPPMVSLPEIKRESFPSDPLDKPARLSSTMKSSSSTASQAESNYRLGPEDVIFVSVWGNKELTMEVVVRPDGKISIPLVQDLQAEGLTAGELAIVIQEKLIVYIKDPSVSVIVKQVNASKFYIVGYVNKPGTYPLRGDVTILQALSLAGGFTQFASPRKIRLVRNSGTSQEVRVLNYYDMIDKGGEGNYLLKPGDTIVVP